MDVAEEGLEEAVRGAVGGRAVRRSSRFHCSGGTCHVTHCDRQCGEKGVEFSIYTFRGVNMPRTHHDLGLRGSHTTFSCSPKAVATSPFERQVRTSR